MCLRIHLLNFFSSLMVFLFLDSFSAFAEEVFTTRGPESEGDERYIYQNKLLQLALEKTTNTHGAYTLKVTPIGSNTKRTMREVERGSYPNFFVQNAVTPDRLNNMIAVPFPLTLGVLGYRAAFVSEKTKVKLKSVSTLKELQQFSILQGLGWVDNKILRNGGFGVITSSSYNGMFRQVATDRADIFLRGVNEIFAEWNRNKDVPSLTYDDSFLIYYDFPAFFFTTKGNERAAERVLEGLQLAYQDGDLQKIWAEEYQESIDFVTKHPRRIFSITNPLNVYPDKSYRQYLIAADIFGEDIIYAD
ncbi:hypothetical protein [Curvivirga sp.]|uniref:hypothetical protein n=1 Tax=Curvivirga sp. TaxID=2856848 RepID=UPI003B5B9CB3